MNHSFYRNFSPSLKQVSVENYWYFTCFEQGRYQPNTAGGGAKRKFWWDHIIFIIFFPILMISHLLSCHAK